MLYDQPQTSPLAFPSAYRLYPLPPASPLDPPSDATADCSPRSVIHHLHSSTSGSPECRTADLQRSGNPKPWKGKLDGALAVQSKREVQQHYEQEDRRCEEVSSNEEVIVHSGAPTQFLASAGLIAKRTVAIDRPNPSNAARIPLDPAGDAVSQAPKMLLSRSLTALPEPSSVVWKRSSTTNSLKSLPRHQNPRVGGAASSPSVRSLPERSPVHRSSGKRSTHVDTLKRFAAANPSTSGHGGGFKAMQFRSLDARIESPSSAGINSNRPQQLFARSPRSPDALLAPECVKTVHSKWDDAGKWLTSHPSPPNRHHHHLVSPLHPASEAHGCRGFTGNPLRLLGRSCNAGHLGSAAEQQHARHYNVSGPEPDVHCVSSGAGQHQLQSNRHVKHREAAPSPPHRSDAVVAPLRGRGLQQQHPQHSQIQSSSHFTRMFPPNDPAEVSEPAILVDRRQREWPSPVAATVLEKHACQSSSSRKCAECGSTVTIFSNMNLTTDRFAERIATIDQRKVPIGSANPSQCRLADDALRPQLFKEGPGVVVSVSLREVGTEMTPVEGSGSTTMYPSKCPSPRKSRSPARHNTPARATRSQGTGNAALDLVELEKCHRAKLELQGLSEGERIYSFHRTASNWSSQEAEEEEVGRSLRIEDNCRDSSKAGPWRKDEHSKSAIARLQREEARIQAWENLKKAKADAELRKLEAKLEKRRSQTTEKIMSKLLTAQRQAEEMRESVRAQQMGCNTTDSTKAQRMRSSGHSSIQARCSCFTCMP